MGAAGFMELFDAPVYRTLGKRPSGQVQFIAASAIDVDYRCIASRDEDSLIVNDLFLAIN